MTLVTYTKNNICYILERANDEDHEEIMPYAANYPSLHGQYRCIKRESDLFFSLHPHLIHTAGSGLQPEPSSLLNTDVCANDVISKDINTGVQVANVNPQSYMWLLMVIR